VKLIIPMIKHNGALFPMDEAAKKRRSDFIPREPKVCEKCGNVFTCPDSWPLPVWRKARFCSRECAAKVVHRTDEEARFLAMVGPTNENGCQIWRGTVSSHGYRQIRLNGRLVLAHRHAYERVHGLIPRGLMVCHTCDVPSCVNTNHHFLGSGDDNNKDCASKHRTSFGEAHAQAKLTEEIVRFIRYSEESDTALSNRFCVSRHAIKNARLFRTWRRVR